MFLKNSNRWTKNPWLDFGLRCNLKWSYEALQVKYGIYEEDYEMNGVPPRSKKLASPQHATEDTCVIMHCIIANKPYF